MSLVWFQDSPQRSYFFGYCCFNVFLRHISFCRIAFAILSRPTRLRSSPFADRREGGLRSRINAADRRGRGQLPSHVHLRDSTRSSSYTNRRGPLELRGKHGSAQAERNDVDRYKRFEKEAGEPRCTRRKSCS